MATNTEETSRIRLYSRLGFGALVVFGMVGSLAGYRQGSALVFAMTAVCWCLTRIVVEALDAWRQLYPPRNPPTSPVTGAA